MVHPKNENKIYITKAGYGNGSKVYKVNFGDNTFTLRADVFNLLNGHAVLTEQASYSLTNAALWRSPQLVQQARLVKLTLVMNF